MNPPTVNTNVAPVRHQVDVTVHLETHLRKKGWHWIPPGAKTRLVKKLEEKMPTLIRQTVTRKAVYASAQLVESENEAKKVAADQPLTPGKQ